MNIRAWGRAIAVALTWTAALAGSAHAAGTVTVTVAGEGRVTGGDLDCTKAGGPGCEAYFADDCEVIAGKPQCRTAIAALTGEPSAGFGATRWGVTGCADGDAQCDVPVHSDRTITVTFRDVTPPSKVEVLYPSDGARLRGSVEMTGRGLDNVGIVAMAFRRGGVTFATDTTSPFRATLNTTLSADGPHQLSVLARDADGNETLSPAVTVTFDNTAPSAVITAGPPSGARSPAGSTQRWTFSASDATTGVASIQCGIDGAFGPCSEEAAHSVSGRPHGSHTFAVRVTDHAGNVATASRTFVVDAVAPVVTFTAGPAEGETVAANPGPAFRFAADEPAALRCSWDGAPDAPCDGAATRGDLRDGRHTLRVTATDDVGNTASAERAFLVDGTPPDVRFTGGVAAGDRLPSGAAARVTFTAADATAVTFACAVDGAVFGPCTGASEHVAAGLAPGEHVIEIQGTDAVGNRAVARRAFSVAPAPQGASSSAQQSGAAPAPLGGVAGVSATSPRRADGRVVATFRRRGATVLVRRLEVRGAARGAKVLTRCRGRGCPRTLTRRATGRTLSFTRALRRVRLRRGAVLEVRIEQAGRTPSGSRWTVRSRGLPRRATR